MEVSQAQCPVGKLSRWPRTSQLATVKAIGLTACCLAAQACSLKADEGPTAPPELVREASAMNLGKISQAPAAREPSQPVSAATASSAASDRSSFASFQTTHRSLPFQRPIGQIGIDIRPKSKDGSQTLPADTAPQALTEIPFITASPAQGLIARSTSVRARGAENFPYQPLYFEQVNLERYGRYRTPLQPATSALRFFATIPALPYAMAIHNPHLAYYRNWPYEAGWGAPRVRELPPFQPRAAVVESAAIVGLAYLLP